MRAMVTPVFDTHVHIFPAGMASRTVDSLAEKGGVCPSYDGTRTGLLDSMRRSGVCAALNCPIATRPAQVDSINRWAAEANRWPVLSLGTVHPDSEGVPDVLRSIRQAGLPGIKLHPEYQHFQLDDARLQPVWEGCAQLGLIVLLHAGADVGFEPPYKVRPADIAALVQRYQDLTLIAAHLGGWEMWDEVEAALCGASVYLDTAFTLGTLEDERFVRIARKHGVARVLFGTDGPWQDQSAMLRVFDRIPLGDDEKRAVLWDNAARLFKLDKRRCAS